MFPDKSEIIRAIFAAYLAHDRSAVENFRTPIFASPVR